MALFAIFAVMAYELVGGTSLREGFTDAISPGSPFWAKYVPKRGDIGDYAEEDGYIADQRYFHGYADIQGIGATQDYCRMVEPKAGGDEKDAFFACALGGTDLLTSTSFRTPSVRQGFKRSRDDYMRDVASEGKQGYCAIIKINNDLWEPRCYRALVDRFAAKSIVDTQPPPEIETLIDFYDGILFWLRFVDDMKDYAENLNISTTGRLAIEEDPPIRIHEAAALTSSSLAAQALMPTPEAPGKKARTLQFNGANQYLRIGDNKQLSFGNSIPLRYMRGFCCWVRFDEFTNNAKIFDFGDGPGKNNVFLGIEGRGDMGAAGSSKLRSILCDNTEGDTIPQSPSGAQPVPEMTPQALMESTAANVDKWSCPFPEIQGRKMSALQPLTPAKGAARVASLIYEVWEGRQRKMRIKLPTAILLGEWVHICITTLNDDAFRPDIGVYINGILRNTQPSGYLPQSSETSHNYIGRSNWANSTSQMANKDELFKGAMFDVRAYKTRISHDKVEAIYTWSKARVPSDEL